MRNEDWDTEEGTYDKTYFLYEDGEEIDSIVDTCLDNALDYFRDNYEGDYIVECPNDDIKVCI